MWFCQKHLERKSKLHVSLQMFLIPRCLIKKRETKVGSGLLMIVFYSHTFTFSATSDCLKQKEPFKVLVDLKLKSSGQKTNEVMRFSLHVHKYILLYYINFKPTVSFSVCGKDLLFVSSLFCVRADLEIKKVKHIIFFQ